MSLTIEIEPKKKYLKILVSGSYISHEAVEEIAAVLTACSRNKLNKVLVDFRDVNGSLTMADRDEFLQSLIKQHLQFRKIHGIALKIAFVGPESMIMNGYAELLTEKTSITVKSLTDITQAIIWLTVEL